MKTPRVDSKLEFRTHFVEAGRILILFPRLRKTDAEKRLDELRDRDLEELCVDDCSISDDATFAQTGGQRISVDELKRIRESIVSIAIRFGFPEQSPERAKAEFDAICGVWLRYEAGLEIGEGSRDEIWSYLTIVLLPDVAGWRFQNRHTSRFLGGVRNSFQRLWKRAFLLDYAGDSKELLGYLNDLQEDSFVQIVERPGFSANPYIASRIAAAWIRASKEVESVPMEGLHRLVMKELTQLAAVVNLDFLSESDLDSVLDSLYREFGRVRLSE